MDAARRLWRAIELDAGGRPITAWNASPPPDDARGAPSPVRHAGPGDLSRARWVVLEKVAIGGALFVPLEAPHSSVDVSAMYVPDPRAAAVRAARVVIRHIGADPKRT